MPELTQERVRELFKYDFETGLLTWKKRKSYCNRAGHSVGPMNNEYLRVKVDKKSYFVHRIIWLWIYGYFPNEIDHINHKRFDNRWFNLRDVSRKENAQNTKLPCTNSSGIMGVSFKRNKWWAQIRGNGKTIYLGSFKDFDKAVAARKEAERKYDFHPNHGLN